MNSAEGGNQSLKESYPVAKLSDGEEQKIRELESELDVVLVAYEDKQDGN
ncbi:hypothetical protein [Cohnella kolymensis]|nr:hypothetical protein [Cohnella kolymensis]